MNLYGAGRHTARPYILLKGCPTDLVPSTAIGAIKPNRRGDPKAARDKRVADSQGVLMTQSLRSTGSSVEEKTLAIGKHGGTGARCVYFYYLYNPKIRALAGSPRIKILLIIFYL